MQNKTGKKHVIEKFKIDIRSLSLPDNHKMDLINSIERVYENFSMLKSLSDDGFLKKFKSEFITVQKINVNYFFNAVKEHQYILNECLPELYEDVCEKHKLSLELLSV